MTGADGVLATLSQIRVIPVVEIEHAEAAVGLARTLAKAGLAVMEVTLRTPAALDAIRAVSLHCPDFLVGAGTLLDGHMVAAAASAGARFGVSPGLHRGATSAAAELGLPFVPGVVTTTEVLTALDAGLSHLKFFPAGIHGGAAALAALAGPLAGTGVRFMPTGGVTLDNAGEYLAMPSVFAVGGTWIAPRADITAERWDDIAARASAAAELCGALVHEARL
jgi:2-dehydro-3-deoxyphosphogluconate aldolase/(4S)-4-hydroxy-2-oxoglutarate aldolase